ncbi:hypothetical protein PHISP_03292 [Aspergillus sp. HF37]|nr:hypothetical protein PHISP_03292 [Aspergillus sp. HF37]
MTTPVGTTVGRETTTADSRTGPAPIAAGPHHSDTANRLDPRIDNDMNNRSQYAPGTTSQGSTGTSRAPTDTAGAGIAYGSSTSPAGAPGAQGTTRSAYDPYRTGYNPSTGAGYDTTAPVYSNQDYRAEYAPSTVNKESGAADTKSKGSKEQGSRSKRASDQMGQGLKSAIAGVHGTGETLRGSLTSALDKAFGHNESAAKNEAIAAEGEREVQTGNLSHHQSERR